MKSGPVKARQCGTVKQLLPGAPGRCRAKIQDAAFCRLVRRAEVCIQRQILGDSVPGRLAALIGGRYATETSKSPRETPAATAPAALSAEPISRLPGDILAQLLRTSIQTYFG